MYERWINVFLIGDPNPVVVAWDQAGRLNDALDQFSRDGRVVFVTLTSPVCTTIRVRVDQVALYQMVTLDAWKISAEQDAELEQLRAEIDRRYEW